jgi:hypothetical protein
LRDQPLDPRLLAEIVEEGISMRLVGADQEQSTKEESPLAT